MRKLTSLMLAAVTGTCLTAVIPATQAQVSINIGVAPACPYGYYDAVPYSCAPAGYYGPEWFNGEVFIGAGPWFHGAKDFRGNVNNTISCYGGPNNTAGYVGQGTNCLAGSSFLRPVDAHRPRTLQLGIKFQF